MKSIYHTVLGLAGWFILQAPSVAVAQDNRHRIDRTDEKELKVKVEYAAGGLQLIKAKEDLLCRLSRRHAGDGLSPRIQYQKNGTTGFLSVGMMQEETINLADFGDQDWTFELTDKIPLSLNVELGASKSSFDFTGLRVRDLSVSLGASSSTIEFKTANRDRMNKLQIEAGVSKLTAVGLCNANFERFEFEGGVGSYILDFSGHLSESSRARVSVGVGKVMIRIPKSVPVRLRVDENFFSSVRLDDTRLVRTRGNTYVSEDFDESKSYLDLKIEAGIGQVIVEVVGDDQ